MKTRRIVCLLLVCCMVFGLISGMAGAVCTVGEPIMPHTAAPPPPIRQIEASHHHTTAIASDGTIWQWGHYGSMWVLPGPPWPGSAVPRQIGTDTDWAYVSAEDVNIVALKDDGSLWTWGRRASSTTPVQIGTDADWDIISSGPGHTAAIREDGSLWAWGDNRRGQFGDGTTISRSAPAQIGTDTDWASISAGNGYTVAIRGDGSLWVWGMVLSHDDAILEFTAPVQVGTDTDWASAAAGNGHTVAIREDGSLWAWGINTNGQLGIGSQENSAVPVQVGTNTNWVTISTGFGYTMAIRNDGSLWAWGRNDFGQLGDSTRTDRNIPVQIGTDTDWANVVMGFYHTAALRDNGSLWAWGDNYRGQFGDGTRWNSSNVPRLIIVGIADNSIATGTIGEGGAPWRLYADGTLVVPPGFIDQGESRRSPWHDYRHDIRTITFTGPIVGGESLAYLFARLWNLTAIDGLTYFDTSNTTNFSRIFGWTLNVASLDLSAFDTRAVPPGEGGLEWMFDSAIALRQLTLGEHFRFGVGLPPVSECEVYTGRWQNAGDGTPENPQGSFALTSDELSTRFDGTTMADTWVRQRHADVPALGADPMLSAFPDVLGTHWAHSYVQQAHARELVRGNPDSTFNPYGRFTRAEAATVLWRVVDSPMPERAVQFSDVAPGAWYAAPVAWAAEQGIILGRGNNLFAPGETITRQEFFVLLERLARWMGVDTAVTSDDGRIFTDHDTICHWARDAALWVTAAGIVRGNPDGRVTPHGTTIRAEAAALAVRFVREIERLREPFVLTILVEETTLPQGENFTVHVELENNSGEDHEITYIFLFGAHIPNWNPFGCGYEGCPGDCGCPVLTELPAPQSRLFEADSVIIENRSIGSTLAPGTHELRFSANFHLNVGQDNHQRIEVWSNPITLTVTPPPICPGCGDERFFRTPSLDDDFEDNAVIVVLTRCVSQRDNRDWTLDDFGNIAGASYVRDLSRLSDREWELIQDGRWQETMVNWLEYRRIMLIRLDQNCKVNVLHVIQQLQQLEFIRAAEPNHFAAPDIYSR